MEIVKEAHQVRQIAKTARCCGQSIGLVPTMGYLHEGHLSLLRRARKDNGLVVLSVFVNPLQFGPQEDYAQYPRDLERDASLAAAAGCDVLFAPTPGTMYNEGHSTYVDVEALTETMCGASRPGHFRGVATVVTKLFNTVTPDYAYFGSKDYQQALIVSRLACDLNTGVEVVLMPIVRETDGLALSSRNVRLTPPERKAAAALYRSLQAAKQAVGKGERESGKLLGLIEQTLTKEPLINMEYIVIVNAQTLAPLTFLQGEVLIALAANIGATRLIDNVIVEV